MWQKSDILSFIGRILKLYFQNICLYRKKCIPLHSLLKNGCFPEWPNGADCKSAVFRLRWFESISTHNAFTHVFYSSYRKQTILYFIRKFPKNIHYCRKSCNFAFRNFKRNTHTCKTIRKKPNITFGQQLFRY